ncbi:MAG: class I SAM-dependent methyltransferase [Planctomycetes bacterium]|nr:class I SAM-dependent methyltransferase [Planctomycetota bacterium]
MAVLCPLCREPAPPRFRVKDLNRRVNGAEFLYRRCSRCRLIFIDPIPENLSAYYRNDYYDLPPTKEALRDMSAHHRWQIEMVRRFVSTGRLLEIGGAGGLFAFQARQAGFDVDVIEMDERCCDYLRSVVGVNAIRSAAPQEEMKTRGPYDVVALWHVLEHLPDPWTCLRSAAQQLTSRGILLVATPNPDAFQFRVLGRLWPHVDAPRHLYLIPLSRLRRELEAAEADLAWVTTDDPGGLHWNRFGWEQSLVNFVGPRVPRRALAAAGKCITSSVRFIERRPLQGSAYTAIFRRKAPS